MLVTTYQAARITKACVTAHGGDIDATIADALKAIAGDLRTSVVALAAGRKTIPVIVSVGMETSPPR